MATKNNQALYIGAGVLAVGGIVYAISQRNKEAEVVDYEPEPQPTPSNPVPTPTITINKSLVLKNGSKGNEVKELQKLLGVTADGIFGPQTEAALLKLKGVKQVTLAQFPSIANINQNALPVNTKVWAAKYPETPYYAVNKNADQSFKLLSDQDGEIEGGEVIGKIVSMTTDKLRYIIEMSGFWGIDYVWVYAKDVQKL